jgi:hypothetical protein
MSAMELIKQIENLSEQERERIFEFVLHSKLSREVSAGQKPRAGWSEDFARVKKEIADEDLDDAWFNPSNEGDKDWHW